MLSPSAGPVPATACAAPLHAPPTRMTALATPRPNLHPPSPARAFCLPAIDDCWLGGGPRLRHERRRHRQQQAGQTRRRRVVPHLRGWAGGGRIAAAQ